MLVTMGIYTVRAFAFGGAGLSLIEGVYLLNQSVCDVGDEDGVKRAKLAERVMKLATLAFCIGAMGFIGCTLTASLAEFTVSLPLWIGAIICDRIATAVRNIWIENDRDFAPD